MRRVVPERIRTERLLLRPWQADDAPRLAPVLAADFARLAPWIPARVATPDTVPALERRLAGFRADFEDAREWRYALLTPDGATLLGEVALFPRDAQRRVPIGEADRAEIGYWLRADATGQGLATEAARAALDLARSLHGMTRVEIRCDARNLASAAVPRRLGFTLAWTEPEPPALPDEPPTVLQVWTLDLPP